MKLRSSRLPAATNLSLLIAPAILPVIAFMLALAFVSGAPAARSSRRPSYGGVLRVEMTAVVNSVDPAAPAANLEESAARQEIDALLYERRNPDGTFAGAGPFRLAEWEPGKHALLAANPDFMGGRPFLDSIEIELGRTDRDRMLDLELGKADFAPLSPEDARQARDRGIRVSVSRPDELLAIVFLPSRSPEIAAQDARAGEALSRAIDRTAIVNFILQKQGEPAGGLLPEWSSGTAFLFPTAVDVSAARALWGQIAGSPKMTLGYDAGDPLEQAVAERIVVNAREAGIALHAQPITSPIRGCGQSSNCDARLVRLPMNSPHPREALSNLESAIAPLAGLEAVPLSPSAMPEQVYERERTMLNGYRAVPLVWLPQVYGLGARVRDWSVPAPGDPWPLADVWFGDPL